MSEDDLRKKRERKNKKRKDKKISQRAIIAELWRRGELSYKLNSCQQKMEAFFEGDTRDVIPILAARRTGKSFYLVVKAVSVCNKVPNAIVKYICPKQKMVQTIIKPIMRVILKDCPEPLKPEWKENAKMYIFPNGSEIHLAGTDNGNHESIRGGYANLCIVDEAGFCDELDYVVHSVLAPTTDTTGGQVYLASTPSKNSSHDFIQKFVKSAANQNKLIKFTIADNDMLTEEKKKKIMERYVLGEKDPQYRREYLCEIINDSNTVVVEEFTEEIEKATVIDIKERPAFYDIYESMDIGFKHLTVVLFSYYDFRNARLVIVDELIKYGPSLTSDSLASDIQKKEKENFSDEYGEVKPIFMRISDNNNPILLNDLAIMHQLNFMATAKDNKEAQINQLRMMVARKQIIISPKCKHLIYHLRAATWDKHRKDFEELPDLIQEGIHGGHADAVDALIYLVRNLLKNRNPYPDGYNGPDVNNTFVNKKRQTDNDSFVQTVKRLININS